MKFSLLIIAVNPLALSQQQDDQLTIKLPNRFILPEPGIENEFVHKIKNSHDHPIHGIIQFYKPPSAQTRYILSEAGINLKQYLGSNAYYASFSKDTNFSKVKELIRYCGILNINDKIHHSILENKIEDWAITEDNQIKILVAFFEEHKVSDIEKVLMKYTGRFTQVSGSLSYKMILTKDQIMKLAKEEIVKWIEPGPNPYVLL